MREEYYLVCWKRLNSWYWYIGIPRDLRDYQLAIEWIERGEKSCL